jgi:phosphatidylglycerophosphatase A
MTESPASSPGSLWRDPLHLLAFGLGAGLAPVAPGTAGTLVAVPLYLLVWNWPTVWYAVLVCAMLLAGIWICGRTARALGVHDHPGIVWDEIVGLLITMSLAPAGWPWLLAGFLFFRFFDIVKPWPIHWLDRHTPGGLGIMLDDVLAGVYAGICLMLAELAWQRFGAVVAG